MLSELETTEKLAGPFAKIPEFVARTKEQLRSMNTKS